MKISEYKRTGMKFGQKILSAFLIFFVVATPLSTLVAGSARADSASSGKPYAQCYISTGGDGLRLDGNCKTTYTFSDEAAPGTSFSVSYTLNPPGGDFNDDYGNCYIVERTGFVESACNDLQKRALLWTSPANGEFQMGSINWLTRLTFKSPISIIDSGNNTEYRMNDEIFGNGTSSYLNDGGDSNAWYIYVPVDAEKKPIANPAGKCLGVLAVELADDGSDMWLKAIQPTRSSDGVSCAFGSKPATQGRVSGSISDTDRAQMYDIGSGGDEILGTDSRWVNFVAPFFWAHEGSIKGFDTSKPEFKPLSGVELDNAKAKWEATASADAPPSSERTASGWSFFTSSECKDEILVVTPQKNELYVYKPGTDVVVDAQTDGFSQCALGRNIEGGSTGLINAVGIPTPIAFVENATKSSDEVDDSEFTDSGSTSDPATVAETEPPVTCATTWRSALAWVICPVIALAEEMIDTVDDVLRNFLYVDIDRFDTDGGLYVAWNNIRQISTVIIVIIALIMIFSEAMGAGIMDTYSVKKLLPKLLIAGIGIQLSWVICRELINIANIVGNGVQGIMLAPFPGLKELGLYGLFQADQVSGTGQAGFIVAVFAGTIAAFGAIATIVIGVLIALIVAFVTLILRYMVIILCVLFAPIAIAMSVLPGTQKTSKLWWESFEKAIIMYPVIMALLAAGKVVSYGLIQAGQTPSGPDGWFLLAAVIAYFAPYALLPTALKAGGTALNKVTGAFNDKSKGVFDKVRGAQEARKKYKTAASERRAFAGQKSFWEKGRLNPLGVVGSAQRNIRKGGVYARSGGFGVSKDDRNLRQKIAQSAQAGFEKEQAEVAQQAWSVAGAALVRDRSALVKLASGEQKVEYIDAQGNKKEVDLKGMSDIAKVQMQRLAAESLVKQKASGEIMQMFGYNKETGKLENPQQAVKTFQSAAWQGILANNYGDVNDMLPQFTDLSRAAQINTTKDASGRTIPGSSDGGAKSRQESAKATAKSMSSWKTEQFKILANDYAAMRSSSDAGERQGARNIEVAVQELLSNENYSGGVAPEVRAIFQNMGVMGAGAAPGATTGSSTAPAEPRIILPGDDDFRIPRT